MSLKRGFTMVEVILALAISTALFAAIVGATSASVFRNRYADTVADLNDYLKNVYARVINVQNIRTETNESSVYCSITSMFNRSTGAVILNSDPTIGNDNYPGRTGCAIYGQLVTFGEKSDSGAPANEIRTYDVIGTVHDDDYDINSFNSTESGILSELRKVGINVVTVRRANKTAASCRLDIAGGTETHTLSWGGRVENPDGDILRGAFMVIRSPITGAIHTYVYKTADETLDVQYLVKNSSFTSTGCNDSYIRNHYNYDVLVEKAIREDKFSTTKDLVVCIGSDDARAYTSGRRAIRILADGQNASAVQLVDMDDKDPVKGNPCLK